MPSAEEAAEALNLRCAAAAEQRSDPLYATAPPASRWLLIEHRDPWPRLALNALTQAPTPATPRHTTPHPPSDTTPSDTGPRLPGDTALHLPGDTAPRSPGDAIPRLPGDAIPALSAGGGSLPAEVSRLCAVAGIRPVLIRRHGRFDRISPRRWALVDSRPGRESTRWGELPTDEHLLEVLDGTDPGTPSTDPIYLVCTHGRHDACCAIRGRPAAAALTAAFPDQTWECSHIGGDRFAANLVFLPHSLFYGHVPSTEAVAVATRYNEGFVVPKYLRGSGAHPPPVQAAQHFARAAGASLSVDALLPVQVNRPNPATWQIHLVADADGPEHGDADGPEDGDVEAAAAGLPVPVPVVTLTTATTTINAAMTCASEPPGQVATYTLTALEYENQTEPVDGA